MPQRGRPRHPDILTPREWEVGELLRERRTTAEIADRLGVSPVTVRRHVSGAVRKLQVADRNGAFDLMDEAHSKLSIHSQR